GGGVTVRARPSTLLAALIASLALGGRAAAEDAKESLDKPAREALAAVSKDLILAAVDDASKAAELAGPQAPADLRRDFDAIHAASRAKDVKDARNETLKKAMLKLLIEETPEAQDVQRRLADLAGKLASEL